jgi:putative oxidoreductase
MTKKEIAKETGTWILTVLLVLMFSNAGIRKFFENGGWTWMFRHVGFPDWFRIVIGVLEVGAAALLLVPRTAAYGALAIIVIMLGAIGTNFAAHMPLKGLVPAAVSMLVAAIVLAARWRQRARAAVRQTSSAVS